MVFVKILKFLHLFFLGQIGYRSKYLLVSICYRNKYLAIVANTHMNLPLSLSLSLEEK